MDPKLDFQKFYEKQAYQILLIFYIKACAIFHQICNFSPSDSPLKTVKSVLFNLRRSFRSQDIHFLLIFPFPFHTFQIQKDKWKWNNMRCHQLTCINLQV